MTIIYTLCLLGHSAFAMYTEFFHIHIHIGGLSDSILSTVFYRILIQRASLKKKKKVSLGEVYFMNAIYHTHLLEISDAYDYLKNPECKGIVWHCLAKYFLYKFIHRKPFLMEYILISQGNMIQIKKVLV